jgi:preprotein translocase SecF subunit
MAPPAVIAVFHDVLVTLGFFSLFQWEVSLTVIAALLTLVGFSVNDTIVVFDRIRENRRLHRARLFVQDNERLDKSDPFAHSHNRRALCFCLS